MPQFIYGQNGQVPGDVDDYIFAEIDYRVSER